MRLKIGARQSDLARLQAYMVGDALQKEIPNCEVEYLFKASLGDKNLTDPLWKMPQKGVFTEDFVKDLSSGVVDLVVHSWKDLPTEERADSVIAATLPRADLRDILFVRKNRLSKFSCPVDPNVPVVSSEPVVLNQPVILSEAKDLPQTSSPGKVFRVYSSSPRRAYNLKEFLCDYLPLQIQHVEFISVRGNVPTRFRKFMSDDVDAFVMAKAAIDRLLTSKQEEFESVRNELSNYIRECNWVVLPVQVNPPAAAQGALAIEVLKSRTDLLDSLKNINRRDDFEAVQEERKILKSYGGGCHQKIGIAVIKKSFGTVKSVRGLTDQGEILSYWGIKKADSAWKFQQEEVWPIVPSENLFFERSPFIDGEKKHADPEQIKGKALWIARSEALPKSWLLQESQLVWASGLKTWQKLSKRGIWVNGSSEGLGEQESMDLKALAPQAEWVKLSHKSSNMFSDSKFPLVATYSLVPSKNAPNLTGKKCFFWMSGSSLQEALKFYPEIRSAYHACGPGNTYQFLRKLIGNEERIRVFVSYEEWRNKVLEKPGIDSTK